MSRTLLSPTSTTSLSWNLTTSDATSSPMPGPFVQGKTLNDFLIFYMSCHAHSIVFLWHFTLPGRFINQACACTVGFLRCWSLDGSEEITQTWCSIGKEGPAQIWGSMWLWRYEELKQDQEGMLRKIADFTGFVLTEEEIQVEVHIKGLQDDWTSSRWHFLETERAHEVWQLPEVQLFECKVSKLVRSFPEDDSECFLNKAPPFSLLKIKMAFSQTKLLFPEALHVR